MVQVDLSLSGLVGLVLALIGAWRGRGPARTFGLVFAVVGFCLALGRWNPLYYLLYVALPGMDLFRAPARWMMLYTLGVAVLAGAGLDTLITALTQRTQRKTLNRKVRKVREVSYFILHPGRPLGPFILLLCVR